MRGDEVQIHSFGEAPLSRSRSQKAINCVVFFFQALFQKNDDPTGVSRIQMQTRRIALRTIDHGDTPRHLPFKKLGFLAFQLWPLLLLNYSFRQVMLQLESG